MTDLSFPLEQFVLQGLSFYPFYVAIILCVFTRIVMLRHQQLCRDIVLCSFFKFMSRPSFYVTTAFLFVLVATMFLVLSAFLS